MEWWSDGIRKKPNTPLFQHFITPIILLTRIAFRHFIEEAFLFEFL